VLEALIDLERQTQEAGGLVLRIGHLYGPGTYAPDGYFVRQVKARAVPIIRGSAATFSFTHVEDAATAMLAALDRDVSGVLNVVDDAPTSIADWLRLGSLTRSTATSTSAWTARPTGDRRMGRRLSEPASWRQ
jgi:nucleoside-diphosphate-sugar epimerase